MQITNHNHSARNLSFKEKAQYETNPEQVKIVVKTSMDEYKPKPAPDTNVKVVFNSLNCFSDKNFIIAKDALKGAKTGLEGLSKEHNCNLKIVGDKCFLGDHLVIIASNDVNCTKDDFAVFIRDINGKGAIRDLTPKDIINCAKEAIAELEKPVINERAKLFNEKIKSDTEEILATHRNAQRKDHINELKDAFKN